MIQVTCSQFCYLLYKQMTPCMCSDLVMISLLFNIKVINPMVTGNRVHYSMCFIRVHCRSKNKKKVAPGLVVQ